jgi:apolipoprotein N-acyltransferase
VPNPIADPTAMTDRSAADSSAPARHPLVAVVVTPVAQALAAGALVAFSLPPWGFWPLAFVGVMLFEQSLGAAPTRRQAAWRGFAFALVWMAVGMCWMWFLTVPGYILTAIMFAGFHAAAAAAAPSGRWRLIGRPAAHTLVEAIRFGFPFGGVPLATLGISQAGGPLLGLARVGGVILLTWVVFQAGCALASLMPAARRALRKGLAGAAPLDGSVPGHAVAALVAIVLLVALASIAPQGRSFGDARTLTVAAVQGGGEQGTSALDVPSSLVTQRLLDATATIEPDPRLDLVVWPENGIDVGGEPFDGSDAHRAVTAEAARLAVPVAIGITEDSEFSNHPSDDAFVNAQVLVLPDGRITGRYEKVRIVPFGEYVPMRGVLTALGAPLDRIASDAVQGRDPARLELPDGTRLGVMISWEVFFGGRGRAAADGDTALLLNPTNGASYTGTVLQTQQIASSRLRAIETGRWVVQVSPTGFTAFIDSDGGVHQRTDVGERAVITMDVPLRRGGTWYHSLGNWPWAIAVAAVLALAIWRGRARPVTPPAAG